jgi:ABC-type Mn2+/Zn2+ transport system ATPase subunit
MVNPPPYEAAIVEDEPAENFYYSVDINKNSSVCELYINHFHTNGTLISQIKHNLSEITDHTKTVLGMGMSIDNSIEKIISDITRYFGPMKLISGSSNYQSDPWGGIGYIRLNFIFTARINTQYSQI